MKEYAQYVEQIRTYARKMPLPKAVEKVVDNCIRNVILTDFLVKNCAEAIAVSIFEYDEEKHMKSDRKEWREIGREEELKAGLDILKALMDAGKTKEVNRALTDSDYRNQLCRKYFQKENGLA